MATYFILTACSSDSAGFKTHGTDDVDGYGDAYTRAARDLKDGWVNHRDDLAEGALQPFQNAESLAAAATGMFIHNPTHGLCKVLI